MSVPSENLYYIITVMSIKKTPFLRVKFHFSIRQVHTFNLFCGIYASPFQRNNNNNIKLYNNNIVFNRYQLLKQMITVPNMSNRGLG